MLVRYGFDLVITHNRVRRAGHAVPVEFFFKQLVDGFIDVERRPAWTLNLQTRVEPEAARTLHKELDFGSADLERFRLPGLVRFAA